MTDIERLEGALLCLIEANEVMGDMIRILSDRVGKLEQATQRLERSKQSIGELN